MMAGVWRKPAGLRVSRSVDQSSDSTRYRPSSSISSTHGLGPGRAGPEAAVGLSQVGHR